MMLTRYSISAQPQTSTARKSLLGLFCALVVLFATTNGSAYAQRRKNPTPTPPPVTAMEVVQAEATVFRLRFSPVGSGAVYQQVEFVSGQSTPPTGAGPGGTLSAFYVDGGVWQLTGLLPDSDYVIRVRNTTFTGYTTPPSVSAWTQFSLRTPTLEASRPSAPVISLGEVTATRVTINWSPSTDNASTATQLSYFYSLNGGALQPTCYSYCFGTTGLIINRPASGSRIVVFAFDYAGIQSLPSNEIVIP